MAFELNKRAYDILTSLAEYRVLTCRHLLTLHRGNERALRKKLRKLEKDSLVVRNAKIFSQKQGRPEEMLSLTDEGVQLLKTEKILDSDIPANRVKTTGVHSLQHQLLTNDFRIQLVLIERTISDLSISFLSPVTPFIPRSQKDKPMVYESFPIDEANQQWIGYTPDGVFSIRHRGLNKTLLFFLEVDMATESLVSRNRPKASIAGKITNYKLTYKAGRYKRYEKFWNCKLHGFRLLFLTSNSSRMIKLCQLVQQMSPSDFIHITDQEAMASEGVWAKIWYKGGRLNQPQVSILGSKIPQFPLKPNELP